MSLNIWGTHLRVGSLEEMGIQAIMSLPRWRVWRVHRRGAGGGSRRFWGLGWGRTRVLYLCQGPRGLEGAGCTPGSGRAPGQGRAAARGPSGAWSCGPKGKGETKEPKERGSWWSGRRGDREGKGEGGRKKDRGGEDCFPQLRQRPGVWGRGWSFPRQPTRIAAADPGRDLTPHSSEPWLPHLERG